jgi:hypothetical protein
VKSNKQNKQANVVCIVHTSLPPTEICDECQILGFNMILSNRVLNGAIETLSPNKVGQNFNTLFHLAKTISAVYCKVNYDQIGVEISSSQSLHLLYATGNVL